MVSPVLGIDLGTTNSVVAYADDARVRVLRDEAGRLLTPSIVAFPPSGEVKVGYAARELRLRDPHNTIYSVKRLLGRPFDSPLVQAAAQKLPFTLERGPTGGVTVKVRNENLALPEVSSFILRHLRQLAERQLDVSCGQAVITVPANFNELQRMATRDAAHIAGIEVLRILNEPTAAALAYGYRAHQAQRVAVYDFGGGTFDISILELSGDVIEVVSTAGDTSLGGDDLDRAVADLIATRYAEQFGAPLALTQQTYARLVMASERIKCQLSKRDVAEVAIKKLAGTDNHSRDFLFRLDQRELAALADPFIERTFAICEEALRLASVRPSQLDAVLLVGGQTRMPRVRTKVSEFFGMQAQCSVDPDLAVAQGAAIQGFALSGSVHSLNADGSEPPLDLDEMSPEDAFGEERARVQQAPEGGFDDEPTAVARRVSPSEPKLPSIRPDRAGQGLSQTLAGMGGDGGAGSQPTAAGSPLATKTLPGQRVEARSPAPQQSSDIQIEISDGDDDDDDEAELPPVLRSSQQPLSRSKEIMSTLLDSPRAKARAKTPPPPAPPASTDKAPAKPALLAARALARQGKIDEALQLYGELLLQDPNDPRLMQEARTLRDMRARSAGAGLAGTVEPDDQGGPRALGENGDRNAPPERGAPHATTDMRAQRDAREQAPRGINETVDMRALRKSDAPGEGREQTPRGINETVDMRALRKPDAPAEGREQAPRGINETVDMRALRAARDRALLGDLPESMDERRDSRAGADPRGLAGADGELRDSRVGADPRGSAGAGGERRDSRAGADPRGAVSPADAIELRDSHADPRAEAGLRRGGAGALVDSRPGAEARGAAPRLGAADQTASAELRAATLAGVNATGLPREAEPTDGWQRDQARALEEASARDSAAGLNLGGVAEPPDTRGLRDSRKSLDVGLKLGGIGETVDMRALRDPRKAADPGLQLDGVDDTVEMRALRDPRKAAEARSSSREARAVPPTAAGPTGARSAHETVDMRTLKDARSKSAPVVSVDLGDEAAHKRPTAAPPRRADSAPHAAIGNLSDAQEEDLSMLMPSLPPQHGSSLPVVNSQLPAPRTRAPLLLDVTPHTLNVETVDGYCEALIERNSPIPTEQTRIFTTSQDQQRMVSVRVSQGESRRTEDNHVLGHIELIELRRAPRGEVQIAVTFVIDADGTLSARALDQATGRSQELRVRLTGAIDPDELERMRAAGRKRSS